MLNVFISSACQNQTRPCRKFYNIPRLSKWNLHNSVEDATWT
nr:MAG TPA: hypothetical protein [Caudoviricetes sp.]